MIHFDLPKEKSSIIKVIGVGGGGGNAVNHMHSQNIEGVNFIIANTDAQALANSDIPNKVQLGPHLTQGLGAGANPEIGRQATEESLEEIKRILEVNTKMAFITAGMGGGTGTGGAPIISKICKDLGILTVGIVTTPFSYEGKKRQLQAEEGIKTLKQYVDTLLVISNDKLRHQFGNLKMREAFEKADNVLATAAKCITDVINSTGQINVDFADVCTVMRNGGVAILGNAEAAGENRAQQAIEEALNSPLLNDNEIRGAKWILININSTQGEHEFTMDEVEVIQNYILTQAGEDTDVILGMGYDNTLGDRIGITLIATGFEHKDPFAKPAPKKEEPVKEEKIVMVLERQEEVKTIPLQSTSSNNTTAIAEKEMQVMEEALQAAPAVVTDNLAYLMPTLVEEAPVMPEVPVVDLSDIKEAEQAIIHWELQPEENLLSKNTISSVPSTNNEVKTVSVNTDKIYSNIQPLQSPAQTLSQHVKQTDAEIIFGMNNNASSHHANMDVAQPMPKAAGGYQLAPPSNIYSEATPGAITPITSTEEPVPQATASTEEDELLDMQMQIVERDDIPAADMPIAHQAQAPLATGVEELPNVDETEEQQRRAAERLHKLRNLSFNINAADPNNEFETVPAYIRRNMELYNTNSHIEQFYSSYEVKSDGTKTEISSINTFLEGKKPD
jgi:cell division protein FtsZ